MMREESKFQHIHGPLNLLWHKIIAFLETVTSVLSISYKTKVYCFLAFSHTVNLQKWPWNCRNLRATGTKTQLSIFRIENSYWYYYYEYYYCTLEMGNTTGFGIIFSVKNMQKRLFWLIKKQTMISCLLA